MVRMMTLRTTTRWRAPASVPVTALLSGCLLLSEPPPLEGEEGGPAPLDGWIDVAARNTTVCALQDGGELWCGDSPETLVLNSRGPFTHVSQGAVDSLCGVYEGGRLFCADGIADAFELEGPYRAVSGGGDAGCGLLEDGRATCWPEASEMAGPFTAVGAGDRFACGIRLSSSGLTCWGIDDLVFEEPLSDVPAGAYRQVETTDSVGCALTTTNDVTCWGYDSYGLTDGPPAGEIYTRIALADDAGCALTLGGAMKCWGRSSPLIESQIPQDVTVRWIDLAPDGGGCVIDSLSQLHCW